MAKWLAYKKCHKPYEGIHRARSLPAFSSFPWPWEQGQSFSFSPILWGQSDVPSTRPHLRDKIQPGGTFLGPKPKDERRLPSSSAMICANPFSPQKKSLQKKSERKREEAIAKLVERKKKKEKTDKEEFNNCYFKLLEPTCIMHKEKKVNVDFFAVLVLLNSILFARPLVPHEVTTDGRRKALLLLLLFVSIFLLFPARGDRKKRKEKKRKERVGGVFCLSHPTESPFWPNKKRGRREKLPSRQRNNHFLFQICLKHLKWNDFEKI